MKLKIKSTSKSIKSKTIKIMKIEIDTNIKWQYTFMKGQTQNPRQGKRK